MSKRIPFLVLVVPLVPVLARAQGTERVSTSTSGVECNGQNLYTAISGDGRFVTWQSVATNLAAGDTNAASDVFVKDRLLGTTERVSVASDGSQGNGNSHDPLISADGRYVAFFSYASNLVVGDTNSAPDGFVHDRVTHATVCVSAGPDGLPANGGSRYPAFSGDGHFVTFHSVATNLVAGDTNARRDVFLRELATGTTEILSLGLGGIPADGDSANAVPSSDARFVAFESLATNLVAGDTNGHQDIFVRDRVLGVTWLASPSYLGGAADGECTGPAISRDGRHVAFASTATDHVAGDTNLLSDVFVRDLVLGTMQRVSLSSTGAQGNGYSYDPALSADARWVAFPTRATNLTPGDHNTRYDILLHDRWTGTTERASVSAQGAESDDDSLYPALTPDGRFVSFESAGTNLVAGDVNGERDIFVRDRGTEAGWNFPYCFGDGATHAVACPCGNAGASGRGCANSVEPLGARLVASGTPSVMNDTLVLVGTGMPDSSALYFQGTLRQAGGIGVVFGDGLRCVAGTILRLATRTNVVGESRYPEVGDPAVSVRGSVPPGAIRMYQAWYRNASPVFCTSATFNLTNGVQVVWGG